MRRALLLALALLAPAAPARAANPPPHWFAYDRPATYDAPSSDVFATMRDGAQLHCTLYRPTAPGRYPAILNNVEPYSEQQNDAQDQYLATHGYAVASCSPRGARLSIAAGPLLDPFSETEQHDMYDLIEWMAAQPWSDGRVGVAGYSYGAILAYLAAAQRPPHLRAVAARAAYSSAYRDIVYLGGIRGLDVQAWELGLATNSTTNVDFRRHPLDDGFWRERAIDAKWPVLRASKLPILDYGGWYDIYQDAEPRNYQALRSQTWLVMGPGAHLDSSPVPDGSLLAWFDHWIGGRPAAPLPDARVISYEMPMLNGAAGHGWTQLADWPPPGTRTTRLRFTAAHGLAPAAGASGSDSSTVDPLDGAPTYWNHGYSEVDGFADQRAQDTQRLTYTTAPLARDLVVAGPVEATLRAALSATDGNLVVRLTDVAPSGASVLAATGWLKASHRLGHQRLAPIEPGRTYAFGVHVWATHWRFAKGHSLRLSVSSGDLPRIEPDAPAGTVTVATGAHGSYADLPIAPSSPGPSSPRSR